jgi:phenylalanyl-tRNA synthetase beta chain
MKISWNWLSELVDLSGVGGPQKLADLLTSRGLEVEEIHSPAKGLEKVVTARILEKSPHPQSDRLSLCKVSTGQGEALEIVCGAQNMKAGDTVALAQVGAELPNGMKIGKSKIRGVESSGMLCSEEELKLKESSEGILILPPATRLGQPLAEVLSLNDTVLTFKLTANRGDCMSHFGMAREIASALGQKARRPAATPLAFSDGRMTPVQLALEAGAEGPQFWGCAIEGVRIGPSPAAIVKKLEAVGQRSINNVVDATNLVLLELGQPVHAYDLDRIQGGKLAIRLAREGESVPLLDGTEARLGGQELVIADGARAVGLAGVMGGGNSEVSDQTTRVYLEVAEFSPSLVRKAAQKHQKRTEASARFEKGIDPRGQEFAISRLATLVLQLAGGKVIGTGRALHASRAPGAAVVKPIAVEPAYFERFLGMKLAAGEVEKVLTGLDCAIDRKGDAWSVTPPTYRRDLNLREDLAEEIARSLGYDRIPSTVPALSSPPSPQPPRAEDLAKQTLVMQGLNETVNYSFTSSAWLSQLGLQGSVRIQNPLSEEHEVMTPSLLPLLVRNALDNWRHHFGSEALPIRLFELRPTFHAQGPVQLVDDMRTNVLERWKLAVALSGPRFATGLRNEQGEVDFYDLKAVIEALFERLGTRGVRFNPLSASRAPNTAEAQLFHPGQAVEVLAGNGVAGHFGLLHPAKARQLKTRAPLWLAELDWEMISKLSRGAQARAFSPWPEFPPMERDFALVVKDSVTADKITQVALKAGRPLAKVAKIFDVYRGSQVPEGMTSVAVRVIFFEEGRSLQEAEAEATSAQILQAWSKELGAELRG